jgi:cobalt-zinc-cadmium efflux system membrane fusion protein
LARKRGTHRCENRLVLSQRQTRFTLLACGLVAALLVVGLATGIAPALWGLAQRAWAGSPAAADDHEETPRSTAAELFRIANGDLGLRLRPQAVEALQVKPVAAREATAPRPLPPQIGTLNYDNDRLFSIRPRFQGELAEVKEVPDTSGAPSTGKKYRPLRFGDRVRQGELLAVLWSRDLGEKKAALVDALNGLRFSQAALERQNNLYKTGATSLSAYLAAERQVQSDSNAVLMAERTLKMWKLTDEEVADIKAEAKLILDQKKVRDPEREKLWARVEVRVPQFSADSGKELVVVEKNTHLGDMVDPSKDTPLFRVADLSRLQIWVHPPEEYLPLIRDQLQKRNAGAAELAECVWFWPALRDLLREQFPRRDVAPVTWQIRFQSDPPDTPPLELEIVQIAPSLEPFQHTPMVMGYLNNPDGKYLIGQFVTATIFMPPEPNTVEIPTDALNEVEGQALVFVETDAARREFTLRRVAVARRFKDVTYVRSVLTAADEKVSVEEVKRGRRPLRPLLPGERVVTRGVVEMTQALDTLESQGLPPARADR